MKAFVTFSLRGSSRGASSIILPNIESKLNLIKNARNSERCSLFFNESDKLQRLAVVGLGDRSELTSDAVRRAASVGVRALQKSTPVDVIEMDCTPETEQFASAIAEGAVLGLYKPLREIGRSSAEDEDDDDGNCKKKIEVRCADDLDKSVKEQFDRGIIRAEAENVARYFAERPANLLTPRIFAEECTALFSSCQGVETLVRNEQWLEEQRFGLLLGVARGSREPARLLEIHYTSDAASQRTPSTVFVGKGVTMDTGGISLKPANNMYLMKGDCGGAAAVIAAMYGIARLQLPVRVSAFVPLVENMPGGNALKPGDVLKAYDSTTVEVDNTDAEGRLILADTISYAQSFQPDLLVTVATLTGAIDVALGNAFTGVFSSSDENFGVLRDIGEAQGQRMWRMPLDRVYRKQLRSNVAQLLNCSRDRGGGACTAAAFLHHFVKPSQDFMHLDIAGTMHSADGSGYLPKGMTGTPTRSLISLVTGVAASKGRTAV